MVSIDGQVESAGYRGDRFDVRDVFDLRYGVMNACLDVREDVARLVGFGHFFLRRAVEAQVLSLRVVTKECLRW